MTFIYAMSYYECLFKCDFGTNLSKQLTRSYHKQIF